MKARRKDTLLLIGSKDSDRFMLHTIFEPTYYILEAENIPQGILLLNQNNTYVAAVIADVPLTDDDAVRDLIAASNPNTEREIPVMLLVDTKDGGHLEERAFILGATDVVLKPYATLTIQRRLQVLVDLYLHQWHLEKLVEAQKQNIRSAYQTMLDAVSTIIENRSVESGNHSLRIRDLTRILLEEVAKFYPEYGLTPDIIENMSAATVFHDLGKIVIPDAILKKPSRLTPEEFEIMKTHTTKGGELIAKLNGAGEEKFLRYAYNICLYHHERWDGNGYPAGLKGDEIPICAQVVGITDAFDALITERAYKQAFSYETAANMIMNGECGQFAPALLECFKRVYRRWVRLVEQYTDEGNLERNEIIEILTQPEPPTDALDTLQISQLKYQTILHHLTDTVIEVNLKERLYHIVHNPNSGIMSAVAASDMGELTKEFKFHGIHPEDLSVIEKVKQELARKLFVENQRKYTFYCRLYSTYYAAYQPYEVTMLRVNTRNESQRLALGILHNLETDNQKAATAQKQDANESIVYDLMNTCLYCNNDRQLTVAKGNQMLSQLTGYYQQELETQFENSLMKLMVPEDRQILDNTIHNLGQNTSRREVQYRLLRKYGDPIWVLDRCRTCIDADGTEYSYHVLTDISSLKNDLMKQERKYIRNQVVADQFKHVVLEWDLLTDTMLSSEQWIERFGYELPEKNFSQYIGGANHIHPDDMGAFKEKLQILMQSEAKEVADIRVANSEGRYYWCRIRAVSQTKGQGKPTVIIAVVYDINDLKHSEIILKQKTERDGLTKLLNKESAKQAGEEYLKNRKATTLAAMLVLDIDNFKMINDNLGHLYGDAVLSQIGTNLRNMFRAQDIIGRIGGDEFLVLLKDLPNLELVKDRCELLVNTIGQQMQKLMPEIPVSLSVGVALIPKHGVSWGELFQHADEALYVAKRKGKGQYKIYDEQDKYYHTEEKKENNITQIDTDGSGRLNETELVRMVFHNLYASRDIEATVNEALAFVGSYFNVSRVYIFENNADDTGCNNTFEWCNVGIVPQIDNLQGINYANDVPSWQSSFNENGIFYSSDIQKLPQDLRDTLEPQGIKSVLHCAMLDKGVFKGVVGFDECNANYLWTQEQIELLEFLAEVLAVFLMKWRKQERNN